MKDDSVATHWVLENSDERARSVLRNVYNLGILSLHGKFGCKASGGSI